MFYKKCLIICFWIGDRRYEYEEYQLDKLYFLKKQIEVLKSYKNNLNKIIFNFNIETEHYHYLSEIFSLVPKKIQGSDIEINIRKNVGLSYGAWSDVFKKYSNEFDYYIFNEDDYFFVENNWDDYLVDKHNSYDDCGYLCMTIREPHHWNNYRKIAGSSVGIASTNTLKKIVDKYGKLPSKEYNTEDSEYNTNSEVQNEFGFSFIEIGLNIYDVRDDYSVLFQKESPLEKDVKCWRFFGWNEKYLSVCLDYFRGHFKYWNSTDSEFTKEYKTTTLEETKSCFIKKLPYYDNKIKIKMVEKNKDLIIITSYTPDSERQNLLRKFINQIDKTNFDIMVSSHTFLPNDLYEHVDYFLYDKENTILTDTKHKYKMFWGNGIFNLNTTEARHFNHFIAAYKLVFMGLMNAKNIGYEKAHVIEYDTEIIDMKEFEDNSTKLDLHDIVYYKTDYSPSIISFPMSFNLKRINKEWFTYDKQKLITFIEKNDFKTIEQYEIGLLSNEKNTLSKDYRELEKNGVSINLFFSGGDKSWVCPVVNGSDILDVFVHNRDEKNTNIKLVINDDNIINLHVPPNNWMVRKTLKFEEVKKLIILKDDIVMNKYEFNDNNREEYKKNNFITNA